MRLPLFIVAFIFGLIGSFAQPDSFSSPKEMLGKQVYVMPGNLTPCTYIMIDGKLKPAQKDKKHVHVVNEKSYTISNDLYMFKKENYLVLNGNSDMFFLKETDSPMYLAFMKNESFWKDYVEKLNDSYIYLDIEKGKEYHKNSDTECYDKLSRIKWKEYSIKEPRVYLNGNEVTKEGSVKSANFIIGYDKLESLKDVAFIHKNNITPYVQQYEARLAKEKREKEIQDSLYNRKLRLATAKKELTFPDEDGNIYVHYGDTIAIYNYNDSVGKFVGRFRYANIRLEDDDIKFIDSKYGSGTYHYGQTSEDKEYLKKVKDDGCEERFATAYEYDLKKTQIYINKIKQDIKTYEDGVASLKSKQIFITEADYNYDDEQFGMDYTIFNCFSKTIKYVAITLTCYNNVGDLQRDYFGRATKTVRGIGPIEPGEEASFSWEKVFWDEYDVIKRCDITSIVFTFSDGTKKTFSGRANIEKHIADDAWDD